MCKVHAAVPELVYGIGSKPIALRGLWVRVPPAASHASRGRATDCGFIAACEPNVSTVADVTGIPRSTVRDWLKPSTPTSRLVVQRPVPEPATVPKAPYSYLLGFYLGDGCISRAQRSVYRLRIKTDSRYPAIIDECRGAIRAVARSNRVNVPAAVMQRRRNKQLLKVLAAALPAARTRPETQAADRVRAVAARDRQALSARVPPRPHPLGRMPRAQPRKRQGVPPLFLHAGFGGHQNAFLRRL